MSRYFSAVVPPIPQNMSHFEAVAWRLWRRGWDVRSAARAAGIAPNELRRLLGHPLHESADNPPKSKFVEVAQ